jgi:hypothetical protein
MSQPANHDQQLATLRLTYERLCDERDRLRDARGHFARGLGPAPVSAGIATVLVSALSDGRNPGLLWLAVAALIALIVVGLWYDGKPSYRHLYALNIEELRGRIRTEHPRLTERARLGKQTRVEDLLAPDDWYRAMIGLERDIYGDERTQNEWRAPWQPVQDLQDGLDHERTGLRFVQALWVAVVAALVLSVVV